ncbi:disease resistance protein RPV1 [Lactuca sativa]|uniref:TIR domain-containing protein n=1 Tax=Lactuca sativa TaxID=4236 RepID=A0A9R1VZU0_LACSA|nr:disease resistance protein RPV1 [Lactuca sativa]KAJ0214574.1 hypothetical protein LSAT_V11C400215660 [Lactuca sativa]
MESSSTLSIHRSFKYDVFLSFRGEDTRKNFVDHLYHALQHKSIHTYKDDVRIKKGKRISDELIGSIKDSKFYIIVFSKNYASSSWCLDELVKIMECHRTKEHTAYSIFYDVEPSDVRKQSGAVGEAFAKHEKKEAAGKWRQALKEAADLAGWVLQNTKDGHEAKFIKKIVEELSLELRSISFNVDENLVGMESRINDVLSSLGTGTDDVRMMGIKGIGGGGKTTLARALFDQISFQFEGKSFVENVREVSTVSFFGLKSLQNQLLSDVLNDKKIRIKDVSDGKHLIKKMMRHRKVLVVLDDVDHKDQLEALAGEPSWFMPGSIIIITTRDKQVLVAHHVKLIHDVNLLSDNEAICLFNRYAFGREIQFQEYENLRRQVVRYASGLPLTIRVLGSFLCGKNEPEWKDALERLKTIPLNETLKKLELSYIALEEDYKEMFLDVACIMKGWRKDDAIKALESCGFHAINGLRVLEQKSLITINDNSGDYKYVGMHDHIEEMGRNIVRRSHPDKPHKHTRLWIYEEIENILANDLGTKGTRCIRLDAQIRDRKFDIKGLGKMKELRFLYVGAVRSRHWDSNIVNPEFPNALRYLSLMYYPFRSLPITFQANNLVALKMVGSEIIQLWEGGKRKVLNKLRILDLSSSMLTTLDLGLAPNLEKLDLGECSNLVKLHMSVECLKLVYVNLRGARLITNLDLRLAPNLEELILSFCNNLEKLQMPDRCLNLRYLLLERSKLRTFDIGLNPNLSKLDLGDSHYLEELYMGHECQKLANLNISHSKLRTLKLGLTMNLETLYLRLCCHLVELHMPIEFLKLKYINLEGSSLRTLDLGLAPNLEELYLVECNNLEELHMPNRCLNLQSLRLTNSKLRTLDIGQTPNLRNLDLYKNSHLEELYMRNECQMLTNLNISHSKLRTLDLGLTPNLERLDLEKCCNLVELLPPIGGLKKLVHLYLRTLGFEHFSFEIKNYTSCSVDESLEEYTCSVDESLEEYTSCVLEDYTSCSVDESLEEYTSCNADEPLQDYTSCVFEDCNSCSVDESLEEYTSCSIDEPLEDYTSCVLVDYPSCSVDESLEVGPLAELYLTVNAVDSCLLHPENSLPKFQFSCYYVEGRPSSIGNVEMLISQGMCACTNLETFSGIICGLRCLRRLELKGNIIEVLKDLDKLECLEELSFSSTEIMYLPDSICMLKNLKSLQIISCFLHGKLPEDLGQLECLESLDLSDTNIEHLPDNIFMLKNLRYLNLKSCSDLEKLPENLGELECLENLYLSDTNIKRLPDSIFMLKNLRYLNLKSCLLLEKLPEDLGQVECLENLDLSYTNIKRLPDSIFMLKNLRYLNLKSCSHLEKLPEDLGQLECLENLDLSDTNIEGLPDSICMLKHLKYLQLNDCSLLERLPEELGCRECLKELSIEGTRISDLPQSILLLKGLHIVGSTELLDSCGFTSEMQTLHVYDPPPFTMELL